MNTNSFLSHQDLLPVTVVSEKDAINYYFNQDIENYVFNFLKNEMPGIIVGDIDDDIISALKDGNNLKLFQGQCYSEYFEPIDSDRSIGSIKEIYSTDDLIKFYTRLFSHRRLFSTSIMQQLNLKTLEEIFFNEFKLKGFEKSEINVAHNNEGFKESYVIFKNQEGKAIEVIYPEYDYDEGNGYNYFMPEANPNWLTFFTAIIKGDILSYSYITFK